MLNLQLLYAVNMKNIFPTILFSGIFCLIYQLTTLPAYGEVSVGDPPVAVAEQATGDDSTESPDNTERMPAAADSTTIKNFADCVKAGYPISKSMPPQCHTPDGKVFLKDLPVIDVKPGKKFCKDLCGDGKCQEMVCMAVGCPCAETAESCPADCK